MEFIKNYLSETKKIVEQLDLNSIENAVSLVKDTRKSEGRIFFIGVGGGAAHASHAVNDFRKIGGFECYSPVDNVSELTARINDESWDTAYLNWLKGCRLKDNDLLFIFSVGGGNAEKKISVNIVESIKYAQEIGAKVCGIVGRSDGWTAKYADVSIIIPTVNDNLITPHVEGFQAVIWHLIVSHPAIQLNKMKWEMET